MKNLQSGLEWLWSRTKFINRKYLMQEMYQNFEEGEEWQLPDERDPFWSAVLMCIWSRLVTWYVAF